MNSYRLLFLILKHYGGIYCFITQPSIYGVIVYFFVITQPSIYRVIVYFMLCHESLNYSTGQ